MGRFLTPRRGSPPPRPGTPPRAPRPRSRLPPRTRPPLRSRRPTDPPWPCAPARARIAASMPASGRDEVLPHRRAQPLVRPRRPADRGEERARRVEDRVVRAGDGVVGKPVIPQVASDGQKSMRFLELEHRGRRRSLRHSGIPSCAMLSPRGASPRHPSASATSGERTRSLARLRSAPTSCTARRSSLLIPWTSTRTSRSLSSRPRRERASRRAPSTGRAVRGGRGRARRIRPGWRAPARRGAAGRSRDDRTARSGSQPPTCGGR